jgi:arylsulfatase A-like enzyme
MGYTTPNIDRIGMDGIRFTDHYAQPSCTAGRAAFITGQYPIRSDMTTVGSPGDKLGLQAASPSLDSFASANDDRTVDPRFGPVGRQTLTDTGPLTQERMKDFDAAEVIPKAADFMKKSKAEGKPFFVWLNATRMHLYTRLKFNIRMDPFESYATKDSYGHLLQKTSWMLAPLGELMNEHLKTLADFPPVQGGKSFDMSNIVQEFIRKSKH